MDKHIYDAEMNVDTFGPEDCETGQIGVDFTNPDGNFHVFLDVICLNPV